MPMCGFVKSGSKPRFTGLKLGIRSRSGHSISWIEEAEMGLECNGSWHWKTANGGRVRAVSWFDFGAVDVFSTTVEGRSESE